MKKIEKRGGLCDLDTLDREEGQVLDDVDYVEQLVIKWLEETSFDKQVNADWELNKDISLFTGEHTLVISVVPEG